MALLTNLTILVIVVCTVIAFIRATFKESSEAGSQEHAATPRAKD